jgi:endonuclease/exonuclease/phosphatase family metal-dependent hydrolase
VTSDLGLVVGEGRFRRSSSLSAGSIKVVSWNIRFGLEVDAAIRFLRECPELCGADVLLLQEMDEIGTARIAETLGLDYVYGAFGVHPQSGRDFGNAVLARWSLSGPDVRLLPHRAAVWGHPRVLVTTTVVIGGEPVLVGSVHTEVPLLSSPKRRRQFDEIARLVAGWPGERIVVGGDFNTVTSRGVSVLDKRLAVIGASRVTVDAGPSLRRGVREFTLDHVFARGWSPVASGVVAGSGASDHRPVWVELARSEPAVRV